MTDHLDLKGRLLFEFWTLSKDTQSLICNIAAKLAIELFAWPNISQKATWSRFGLYQIVISESSDDTNIFIATENSPQRAQQA